MSSKLIAVEADMSCHTSAADLDRRIEALVAELAAGEDGDERAREPGEPLRPRWIRPAELVRRMQPFMVWN